MPREEELFSRSYCVERKVSQLIVGGGIECFLRLLSQTFWMKERGTRTIFFLAYCVVLTVLVITRVILFIKLFYKSWPAPVKNLYFDSFLLLICTSVGLTARGIVCFVCLLFRLVNYKDPCQPGNPFKVGFYLNLSEILRSFKKG